MALIGGQQLLQQALNGLFAGSIYALFAVGYTLVFGVLEILNLAHSAVFSLGAVVAFSLAVQLHWPLGLAVLAAIAGCGLVGLLLELTALRPLRRRGAPALSALITSLGCALVLVSLMESGFGANTRRYPNEVAPGATLHLAGAVLDATQLVIIAAGLGMGAVLGWLVRSSRAGRAMRAVAEDPEAARLQGVNADRVIAATLVISSALGGLAGILFSIAQSDVGPFIGRDEVELRGLVVMVVGGMGSIPGALLAGYLLGLVEVLALVVVGAAARPAIAFGVLLIMLVLRPAGLLSRSLGR